MSGESPELLIPFVGPALAVVSMVAARRGSGASRVGAQWTFWVLVPIAAVATAAALFIWPEVHYEWERGPSGREIMLGGFAFLTAATWLVLVATELTLRLIGRIQAERRTRPRR